MSNKNYKQIKPIEDEDMKNISGGEDNLDYWVIDGCSHPDKTPTNEYKEEPFFIFWTRRVRKWHCNVCNMDIWLSAD